MASTGMRHVDTQTACAMKAPKNFGGEVRMLSKRESAPFSELMRLKRKEPRRAAQMETAAERASWRLGESVWSWAALGEWERERAKVRKVDVPIQARIGGAAEGAYDGGKGWQRSAGL